MTINHITSNSTPARATVSGEVRYDAGPWDEYWNGVGNQDWQAARRLLDLSPRVCGYFAGHLAVVLEPHHEDDRDDDDGHEPPEWRRDVVLDWEAAAGRIDADGFKAILFRLMHFGVRTLIAGDVKDEYEQLCRAVDVQPFALGVGMPARINPLDAGPLGNRWDTLSDVQRTERARVIFGRWLVLLKALIGAQGVATTPADEDALTAVLTDLTGWAAGSARLAPVTIPHVWAALRDPTPGLAHACRYSCPREMTDATRQITAALGAMVRGALAGLFDEPTNIAIDWAAPIASLSLGRLQPLGDEAIGTALACLNSWSRAMTDLRQPGEQLVVVRDEVWRQMRLGAGAVQSLDADLRLSRFDACIQMVVAHKPSDMLAAGELGSQAATIAKDLLSLCDTKVLLGQDRSVAAELQTLLGLSDMETDDVAGWARQRRGRAVWRVGERSYRVQTIRGPLEAELFDTNQNLRGTPS